MRRRDLPQEIQRARLASYSAVPKGMNAIDTAIWTIDRAIDKSDGLGKNGVGDRVPQSIATIDRRNPSPQSIATIAAA